MLPIPEPMAVPKPIQTGGYIFFTILQNTISVYFNCSKE